MNRIDRNVGGSGRCVAGFSGRGVVSTELAAELAGPRVGQGLGGGRTGAADVARDWSPSDKVCTTASEPTRRVSVGLISSSRSRPDVRRDGDAVFGGLVAGMVAVVLGFLLANYRAIFFAMLSLAFSMILYGLLVKSRCWAAATASTSRSRRSRVSQCPRRRSSTRSMRCRWLWCSSWRSRCTATSAPTFGRLAEAVRDNELRVEYMGASVRTWST